MLQVSISGFKADVGKYIDMAATALFDILPAGADLDAAKDERLR